jgi:hypothetical protein
MPWDFDDVIGRRAGVLTRPLQKFNASEIVTGLGLTRDGDVKPTRDGSLNGVLGLVVLLLGNTAALAEPVGILLVAVIPTEAAVVWPVGGKPRVDGRFVVLCNGFRGPRFRVVTPPMV